MGPKPKKAQKNAFSFFLEDYVKDLRAKNRHVSHRIAAEECGPLWQELSKEEKSVYIKKASELKMKSQQDKSKLLTCIGVSLAEVEKEEKELHKKMEEADNEIKTTISDLDFDSLKTHLVYLIHCNYYCKTDEDVYIPGELAISEFNLIGGVRRTYHNLIDPGQIPLGFALEAKTTSENIHGLPYPPYEEGDSDYLGILEGIVEFLQPGILPDGRLPPLYCTKINLPATESVLSALAENREEKIKLFRVFNISKMFYWLKNACVKYSEGDETMGFPVLSSAESEIARDVFCYTPGISCVFHKNCEEKYHNCSLSVVQRLVFIICDHCCQHVGVQLIPGKHCRKNCDTDRQGTVLRIEKESNKRRQLKRKEEGKRPSFCGDDSSVHEWKRDVAGSFLHEEMASTFSSLEIYPEPSGSRSRMSFGGGRGSVGGRRPGKQEEERGSDDEDEDEEDFKKVISLGRGISFR